MIQKSNQRLFEIEDNELDKKSEDINKLDQDLKIEENSEDEDWS